MTPRHLLPALFPFVGLATLVAGCSSKPAPAPVHPMARKEPTPVALQYRVTGKEGEILAGASALQIGIPSRFSLRSGPTREAELTVEARPVDDERYLVRMRWREDASTGVKLDWAPGVIAKRGELATVGAEWADGGRTIAVTVLPDGQRPR